MWINRTSRSRRSILLLALASLLSLTLIVGLHPCRRKDVYYIANESRPSSIGNDTVFPHKVWQTWQGNKQLEDEPLRLARTWVEMNPGYGYELLTDDSARSYITKTFPYRADILQIWDRTRDYILRADLIRYLVLLGDGGLYTDMDTDCTRPISEWLSDEQAKAVDLVVGIEFDTRSDDVRADMDAAAQLCSWSIMAKPGSRHIQHVTDTVLARLQELGNTPAGIHAPSIDDVLRTTGPRVFTNALLSSMSKQIGVPITTRNLSYIEEPKVIGSVLILPISSFASGQEHSASKPWGNEQQLLSHHWSGFHTWKLDYDH
nr:hypothetical protein B0A51_02054 [Rachicladosporium sp. CCFEE 5018]